MGTGQLLPGLNPLRLVCDECDKAEKLARKQKNT